MYYTYIIFSITKRLYYKGISSDLEKRLAEHNADKSRYINFQLMPKNC
ncbi:MAG: GIY-YIG nuclease family protein [Bacteroidetes bacterium]|nr:GIY-YIG nuclease family protein [Bacteroidota bacterium]